MMTLGIRNSVWKISERQKLKVDLAERISVNDYIESIATVSADTPLAALGASEHDIQITRAIDMMLLQMVQRLQ